MAKVVPPSDLPEDREAITTTELTETLAQLGATVKGGVCRLALTDLDRQARDLFVRQTRWALT